MLAEKVQSERHVAAVLIAAGAEMEMPSMYSLDVALGLAVSAESEMDQDVLELRMALGLSVA